MRGIIKNERARQYSSLHVINNYSLSLLFFDVRKSMKKKTLLNLPKLKQDVVKSIFHEDNKRYGGIVEKIIQRKQKEKKKNEDTKV